MHTTMAVNNETENIHEQYHTYAFFSALIMSANFILNQGIIHILQTPVSHFSSLLDLIPASLDDSLKVLIIICQFSMQAQPPELKRISQTKREMSKIDKWIYIVLGQEIC